MGNEYLDFNEISKSKSEDSGSTVRKSLYSNDASVNFITRMGIHLRDNDYYIKKYGSENNIYGDNYYDDGEKAFQYLMQEFIDFDSGKEKKENEKTKETEKTDDETVDDETVDYDVLDEKDEDDVDDEKCEDDEFKKTVKTADCTKAEGMEKMLEAIENNLNEAITELNSKNDEGKKEKIAVKSSDIKELLSQFKILKETEWERPTKYLPEDDKNPYVKASRAIYRNQFFNAYERIVKEVLHKFSDNPQEKEKKIVKLISDTLRPTKVPESERHKTNTGEYAYNEMKAYAKISDKGYDEEYDTSSSGGVKIEADFEFTHDEDSNTILHRLLSILLERAECKSGTLGGYVNKVFTGKYEFNYSTAPIWDYQQVKFDEENIGKVEEAFEEVDEKTPIKEAYNAFYTAVYGKEGLSANKKTSLGREKTKTLIETFVDTKVAHYHDVLKFLGLPTINKNDAKYKKLFKKLTLNIEETPE